jgi:hypothetical protein
MPFDGKLNDGSFDLQVARRALELLERGWCQGPLARNALGWGTKPWNADAVCWCSVGAAVKAARDLRKNTTVDFIETTVLRHFERLTMQRRGFGLADFNERRERTKVEVLEHWRWMISQLEAEEVTTIA